MRYARGNAVPETALTVSFTLLILYGVVQLATTAFYQVSADGASFVAAHDTVASVGSPTSANKSNAVSAAASAFSKIVANSISVANPNTTTFETDVSQQIPGISGLGNPQALTITSRLVEETAGTESSSPLLNCTQGALNIVNSANGSVLSSASVGLLQSSSLIASAPLSVGSSAVMSLNTTALTNRIATMSGLENDLNSVVSGPASLSTLSAAIKLLPLNALITPALGSALTTPVEDALGGTFTAASELAAVDAKLGLVPAISGIVSTVINPLLTLGGTGLLGANGPLAALNNDTKALQTIDAGATKCS